jgi:hypothetical protein
MLKTAQFKLLVNFEENGAKTLGKPRVFAYGTHLSPLHQHIDRFTKGFEKGTIRTGDAFR